jgi:hypothetical protein
VDVTNDAGQIHCIYTAVEFYEQSEYSVFLIGSTQTWRVYIVVEFYEQFKLSTVAQNNVFIDLIKLLSIFFNNFTGKWKRDWLTDNIFQVVRQKYHIF